MPRSLCLVRPPVLGAVGGAQGLLIILRSGRTDSCSLGLPDDLVQAVLPPLCQPAFGAVALT
jgi:hypothetical protein